MALLAERAITALRENGDVTSLPRAVSQVDEAQIIALLREHFPAGADADAGLELGNGDDAAVLAVSGARTVATVDAVVEDQDFLPVWPCGYRTTGEDVGYKSAAQNLSDVNAMGAVPTASLVVLGLPGDTPLEWVAEYARGFSRACRELGAVDVRVAGGDLSRSGQLTASVTQLGRLGRGEALTRAGASLGDRVVLAGETLGRADVALRLLLSDAPEHSLAEWTDLEASVSRALFEPHPPLALGPAAVGRLSSLMDISDGLARDARRLAAASGVRLCLDEAALRAEADALRGWAGPLAARGLGHVLYGGEDHLLLGTVPPGGEVPAGFRVIGTVTEGEGVFVGDVALDPRGAYDHFGGE